MLNPLKVRGKESLSHVKYSTDTRQSCLDLNKQCPNSYIVYILLGANFVLLLLLLLTFLKSKEKIIVQHYTQKKEKNFILKTGHLSLNSSSVLINICLWP